MGTASKRTFVTIIRAVVIFSAALLSSWPLVGRAETNQIASPERKPSERAAERRVLKMGEPIERSLAVGDVHIYEMTLSADQYVSVVFEKKGVVLVAALFGPDDRKIGVFGSSSSRQGQEPITFVTTTSGAHRIEVRTFFTPSPPGRYTVKLVELRSSTAQDKVRLSGQSCEEKHWLDRENNFLVNEILNSIVDCMSVVGRRLEGTHPQAADIVAGSNADVTFLVGRWHWGEFVSSAYQENLVGAFRMLASAAEEPDMETAFAIMKGVAEDLKIKAEHCRKSTRGLGKEVVFSVRTTRNGKEESGLVIYYKLGIYEFSKDSRKWTKRFLPHSSPTKEPLPASWYFMWAEKPDEAKPLSKVERIEVKSGHEGPLDLELIR